MLLPGMLLLLYAEAAAAAELPAVGPFRLVQERRNCAASLRGNRHRDVRREEPMMG